MRFILLLSFALTTMCGLAEEKKSEKPEAFPETGTPRFIFRNYPYEHYADFRDSEPFASASWAAPCNYISSGRTAECLREEVATIRLYFLSVPERMAKKGFSAKDIKKFHKEQEVINKKAAKKCEGLLETDALGAAGAVYYYGCYYYNFYHKRFLKLKKMLGEPHPVKRHMKTMRKLKVFFSKPNIYYLDESTLAN